MPTALVLALLSQTSQGPVVVASTSSRTGVSAVPFEVVTAVERELRAARVGGVTSYAPALQDARLDPQRCEALRACVGKLAAAVGPSAWVVGVDVGRLGRLLAVSIEVVDAQGALVASERFTSPLDAWEPRGRDNLRKLAAELAKRRPEQESLKEPPPPNPVEVAPALPPAELPPALIVGPVRHARPRVLPWIGVGATAACALVSGGFLVSGLTHKAAVEGSGDSIGSKLTLAMLTAERDTGIAHFRVSLGLAIGAAVLLAVTTWLFLGGP